MQRIKHKIRKTRLLLSKIFSVKFFLNNTDLTNLAFLYKIDIKGFQNQQKIKSPPVVARFKYLTKQTQSTCLALSNHKPEHVCKVTEMGTERA